MTYAPATLKRRFFALAYESLLVGAVTMIAGLIAGGINTLLLRFLPSLAAAQSILTTLLFLGAWWLYFRLNWQHEGQTLPMRVWHIGLATTQGSLHPSYAVLLRRFLWACVFIVFIPLLAYQGLRYAGIAQRTAASAALIWWILPWGFALFNHRRQFLYDYLAGTELVDLRDR